MTVFAYIVAPDCPDGLPLRSLGHGFKAPRISFWRLFFPRTVRRLKRETRA